MIERCAVVIYACQEAGLLRELKQWRSSSFGGRGGGRKTRLNVDSAAVVGIFLRAS
jgi:hypothetical protein